MQELAGCWTEVGAEALATLLSPILTCQRHDIDPYVYLVDAAAWRVGEVAAPSGL